ncbi:hypothetical protein [Thermoproteus tenax]|uniref:Uncharacterized protein n=1 Tax=Thermoproteus tenax (strain ATCC 35583 / DSM 2078 / JCM 9277 / NBRC 100435 / Kra 1) TaxID=768679 RepID=G4RJU9_THETK|nr:hypothetical protein [Thermoproteus tenax]CCC81844.1 hypothetical protein TTX_1204 [Thermoproteus tenax Kra 1]
MEHPDVGIIDAVKKQHAQFLEVFDRELRLMGESLGGLYGLVMAEEDYTCLTAKKVLGKRDKNWGSS